jgi:hypothetical protein
MQEKVITFASPIFFLLIALEAYVAMRGIAMNIASMMRSTASASAS